MRGSARIAAVIAVLLVGSITVAFGGVPVFPGTGGGGSSGVSSLNGQTGVVTATAAEGLTVTSGGGALAFDQVIEATWNVANVRWYCLDGDAGSDSNVGFSDTSSSDCGTKAVATAAALNKIVPVSGKAHSVVILVKSRASAASYNDVASFLAGRYGYLTYLARATVTDATASSVAFADDANDRTMAGGVILTGTNVAGYNPTGTPNTRTVQWLKVGGGSPSWAAEPALPAGARLRFDINTTTVALRGIKRTIVKVAGGDTTDVDVLLPANPVAADVAYIDMPGAIFTFVSAQVDAGNINIQGFFIVGFQTNGTVVGTRGFSLIGNGSTAWCWLNGPGLMAVALGQESLNSSYQVGATGGFISVGASRSLGAISVGGGGFVNANGTAPFAQGSIILLREYRAELPQSFVANAVQWGKVGSVLTTDADPDGIGTNASSTSLGFRAARIVGSANPGALLLAGSVSLESIEFSNSGAFASIAIQAIGINVLIHAALTGSTGNSDVGLDLRQSQNSTIVFGATLPTVTGTVGDVRLCDGTVVTWASLAALPMTDKCGNRFISSTGNGGGPPGILATPGAQAIPAATNGPTGITTPLTPKWRTFKDEQGVTSWQQYWQYTSPGSFDLSPFAVSPLELN